MGNAAATAVNHAPEGGRQPGTRLSVLHRTVFEYGGAVSMSQNTVRLEPRTFPFQRTLTATLRILPATRVRRFTDLFQNITHHFELPNPHQRLEIESRIKVHNLPLLVSDEARHAGEGELCDSSVQERTWQYLTDSRRVPPLVEIWKCAVDATAGLMSLHDRATAIMGWIHREFRYQSGTTHVNSTLSDLLAGRSGVCQDFTHMMIGMCRAVGVPARYASGYLYNGPLDHLVGAQASHAWCEVYLPGAGWIGFDPTNNNLADERYVKVAVGRDYDDVAPVEGTYYGGAHCRMHITVEVEKS